MKFYITTALPYVNSAPHLGFALEMVQADALARRHRFRGDEVFFSAGTDEHGAKIAQAAKGAGKAPSVLADENSSKFKELAGALNISNDDFIRTTDEARHFPAAQRLWRELIEAGDIYKKKYKGLYCVGCEAFITKKDLVGGKCVFHQKEPLETEEENYFFRLSRYSDKIGQLIKSDELKIVPASRKNEILSLISEGLEDVSFSRPAGNSPWGIPVPGDKTQIMYVWCDALVNYVSVLDYVDSGEKFKKYWPADVHCVGKDILRFHAAIWPAMLLSAGISLPKTVFAHGFITSGGQKMSKSLGNVIDPFDIINRYGADALRYYLLRDVSPFEDSDFTEEKFKSRYNGDLANGLGNLTSRVLKMSESYLSKKPPLRRKSEPAEIGRFMENFQFNKAMDFIWGKISALDLYIQKTEPFKIVKKDKEKAEEIVRELVGGLFEISEALLPFMPETAEKIRKGIEANKMPKPLFLRK